jgi:hypothetical protein
MLLSLKYCSVYDEASRNYKLITVQFSVSFLYIILMVQILAILDSSDLIPNFYAISMFIIGNIQKAACRYI